MQTTGSAATASYKLILNTLLFCALMLAVVSLYLVLQYKDYTLLILNKAFADTAFIVIGLSFAVSNAAKFFPFAVSKIMYRKDLGLAGFALVVAHAFTSLFLLPSFFPFPNYYLEKSHILPFLFAIYAFLIYLDMALISNNTAIKLLGGQVFRRLLRVGYSAYVLTLLHFAINGYSEWLLWFKTFNPLLPPEGLWLFIFGLGVLGLRIATMVNKSSKPTLTTTPVEKPSTSFTPHAPITLRPGIQGK